MGRVHENVHELPGNTANHEVSNVCRSRIRACKNPMILTGKRLSFREMDDDGKAKYFRQIRERVSSFKNDKYDKMRLMILVYPIGS